jgi:hypothetical protein
MCHLSQAQVFDTLANCNALIFSRKSTPEKTVKFFRFLSVKQSQPVVSREFTEFQALATVTSQDF